MSQKLQQNKRFNNLVNLQNGVNKKYPRRVYITVLDRTITKYTTNDLDRPKSLFEQQYHK